MKTLFNISYRIGHVIVFGLVITQGAFADSCSISDTHYECESGETVFIPGVRCTCENAGSHPIATCEEGKGIAAPEMFAGAIVRQHCVSFKDARCYCRRQKTVQE